MNRNRLLLLLGVVAVAGAIAVVFVLVGSGSGSSGTSTIVAAPPTTTSGGGTSPATTAPATPVSVLKGVPQHGATLGSASAPVTMHVFEDPQCPYCQEWALGTLPTVVQNYVRTGKIKIVYEGVEIISPNSEPALRAIYAAGAQNKLWNLVEQLYEQQGKEDSGWITTSLLRGAATAVGADADAVLSGSSSAAVTLDLKNAAAGFQAVGAPGTPTFVVQRPLAVARVLQPAGLDPTSFDAALDAAIQ